MERKGESKLGYTSLIISIFALLVRAIKLVVLTIGLFIPSSPIILSLLASQWFSFLITIITISASLFGFCIGLAGIFQKTRIRKSAFIGTTISSAILIFYIFSWIGIIRIGVII